ncbi:hypothetical protein AB5J62_33480 [Amycolatopsis sp. cg5]|uniref:hypothetical protein n=1 Tax=Amycolatopsis sp. cg5 TaxID=3238802 RepID=UPI003525E64E
MRFPWLTRRSNRRPQATPDHNSQDQYAHDQDVARLTARADLIVEELDTVVAQMSTMLREAYTDDAP